jgi:hypothetical protein
MARSRTVRDGTKQTVTDDTDDTDYTGPFFLRDRFSSAPIRDALRRLDP